MALDKCDDCFINSPPAQYALTIFGAFSLIFWLVFVSVISYLNCKARFCSGASRQQGESGQPAYAVLERPDEEDPAHVNVNLGAAEAEEAAYAMPVDSLVSAKQSITEERARSASSGEEGAGQTPAQEDKANNPKDETAAIQQDSACVLERGSRRDSYAQVIKLKPKRSEQEVTGRLERERLASESQTERGGEGRSGLRPVDDGDQLSSHNSANSANNALSCGNGGFIAIDVTQEDCGENRQKRHFVKSNDSQVALPANSLVTIDESQWEGLNSCSFNARDTGARSYENVTPAPARQEQQGGCNVQPEIQSQTEPPVSASANAPSYENVTLASSGQESKKVSYLVPEVLNEANPSVSAKQSVPLASVDLNDNESGCKPTPSYENVQLEHKPSLHVGTKAVNFSDAEQTFPSISITEPRPFSLDEFLHTPNAQMSVGADNVETVAPSGGTSKEAFEHLDFLLTNLQSANTIASL